MVHERHARHATSVCQARVSRGGITLELAAALNEPAPLRPASRSADLTRVFHHVKKCRAHHEQVESHACIEHALDLVEGHAPSGAVSEHDDEHPPTL